MAFRRRAFKRRRKTFRRSRRPRRRVTRRSYSDFNVHRFTRTSCLYGAGGVIGSGLIGPATTVPNPTAQELNIRFRLTDVNNKANFTNLFDQFRIRKVKVDFIPVLATQSIAQVASSIPIGTVITAIDYDNINALGNAPYDYPGVKEHQCIRRFTRTLRPRPAVSAFQGTFAAYASEKNTLWMDTQYTNVEYYGLRVWFPEATGANVVGYRVLCKYWLDFRYTI